MLLVKTELRPSAIAGIGLFAAEDIPKGTKVWAFEPKLDVRVGEELTINYKEFYDNMGEHPEIV